MPKTKIDIPDSKTITARITAGAKIWMLGCGFKPVIEEVPVAAGWVADLGAIIQPTNTELKRNLKLLHLIDPENACCGNPDLDVIFRNKYAIPMTAIVEVKVTKADFRKDVGRKYDRYDYNPPAHLGYLAFPRGMINEDEIPYYWGHLIFGANGNKLLKHKPPFRINSQHPGDTIEIIAAIAERLHNKWHYRELKESIKSYNREQTVTNNRFKMNSVISAISDKLNKKKETPLSELFERWGAYKLTSGQIEDLNEIDKQLRDFPE